MHLHAHGCWNHQDSVELAEDIPRIDVCEALHYKHQNIENIQVSQQNSKENTYDQHHRENSVISNSVRENCVESKDIHYGVEARIEKGDAIKELLKVLGMPYVVHFVKLSEYEGFIFENINRYHRFED